MQRRQGQRSFERGSHVREYWLANCVGFAVAGSPTHARVKAVVVDPADGRAHHVLVGGWTRRRTRVLPAERIEAVDPFERVLYPQSSSPIRTTTRSLVEIVARFNLWLRPQLRMLAIVVRTRCREIATWLRPRLRAAVASVRAHSRDGLEWLRPRALRAARSASRRVRAASGVVAARLHDAARSLRAGGR
jgi:hypothetical protein